MADHRRRRLNAARIVAPVALLTVSAVAAAMVLSFTGEDDDGDRAERTTTRDQTTQQDSEAGRRSQRRFYRVKLNDTLGLIAEKTGVPVERLQELNPELDPQNLIVGQRVKLRE
jgi:LysM domain